MKATEGCLQFTNEAGVSGSGEGGVQLKRERSRILEDSEDPQKGL